MAAVTNSNATAMPEELRLIHQAFRRAVKEAFLTGRAHDPDGKGYAYWKAQDDAEKLLAEADRTGAQSQ